MNKKEKLFLNRLFEICTLMIKNLDAVNIDDMLQLLKYVEREINKNDNKLVLETPIPIWTKFSTMTEEEIKKEFNDNKKYPDIESIKLSVKGFVEMSKVSQVKTRETLIKHILNTYKRGEFITNIGLKEEKSESKK